MTADESEAYDTGAFINLNVPEGALNDAGNAFGCIAHRAASDLDQLMLAATSNANCVTFEQRMVSCRDWLFVLNDTMDEYRTSLVYAYALLHSALISADELLRRTGKARAAGFFLESAALHAFAVAEKAAQLVNTYVALGLQEKREVAFHTVKPMVADTVLAHPFEEIAVALSHINEMRHAHAHRFDPGVVRARVEQVRIDVAGNSFEGRLWRMDERPVTYGEECKAYSTAYAALDGALGELFDAIAIDLKCQAPI